MENVTLSINKTKKGKLDARINFENGKSMCIPPKFDIAESMNNKKCEVERIDGQPTKIVVDGKELKRTEKKQNASPVRNNYKNRAGLYNRLASDKYSKPVQTRDPDIFTASAPYNFVPLNKQIVIQTRPNNFNRYCGNTGYVDLEIVAKTPIYIRGGIKENGEENSDFYKQAGKYRIQGSSLRGMIRTMVEIVSWSKFGSVNDDYLYYRSFADRSHSIRDEHINQETAGENMFDIAEAIFGNENAFMTRVFFGDAFLRRDDCSKISVIDKTPKILSGPKPTSFQLYLDQSGAKDIADLKHYNNTVNIRGNKLYWHRMGSKWEEQDISKINKHHTQYTKIRPIIEGAKFYGKIRFENLNNIELGALLFAIDLPQGLAHKIGMAKPLGLGSIRINSKLYLSDRENRYKDLFAEWSGLENKSKSINKFKSEFENYIIQNLGEKKISLWETNRLRELRTMLDFEHMPDSNKVGYMELKRFKNREILPKPLEVQ